MSFRLRLARQPDGEGLLPDNGPMRQNRWPNPAPASLVEVHKNPYCPRFRERDQLPRGLCTTTLRPLHSLLAELEPGAADLDFVKVGKQRRFQNACAIHIRTILGIHVDQ